MALLLSILTSKATSTNNYANNSSKDSKNESLTSNYCNPSFCSTGCCINNGCASNSNDCQVNLSTFLIVFLPIIVIIALSTIVMCIKAFKKSRNQNQSRNQRHVTSQELNNSQGLTIRHSRQISKSFKVAPINTIQIEPCISLTLPSPSTPGNSDFRIVEINHEDFEQIMKEEINKKQIYKLSKISVSKGIEVKINKKQENNLNLNPFYISDE